MSTAVTSGISATITSVAMLATVPTVNARVGTLVRWWDATLESIVTYRLTASAAVTAQGIQRPTDWNVFTNRKVWIAAA